MKHIRRAAKPWTCKACNGSIDKGERHFCQLGTSLPYGRYITAMVEARYHLRCIKAELTCCLDAERELTEVGK